MAIVSMTGYGRANFALDHGPVQIEIKSTNQKFFEFSSRLPPDLVPYAEEIRKIVQAEVRRGKIHLSIVADDGPLTHSQVRLNEQAAKEYYRALKKLNELLGLDNNISVGHIARMPDVITRTVAPGDVQKTWARTKTAIHAAVRDLNRARKREGTILAKDLRARADLILRTAKNIRRQAPKVVANFKTKALKRLGSAAPAESAHERLRVEVASFAKSCDIAEELVRLTSHLESLKATLQGGGEVGRKVDFICQEMIRETNTMGAKANDFLISDSVIQIKAELEKIREQAQNIE